MFAVEPKPQEKLQLPLARSARWYWIFAALVVLAAFALRVHDLSRIYYELDESDFFNERIYGPNPNSFLDYLILTKAYTTHTWGWPAVMWIACHVFGPSLFTARILSAIAGTVAVFLVFCLVARLLLKSGIPNRWLPALFAAILTALSMPQMQFSQRAYPYCASIFLAAALLLVDIEFLRALSAPAPGRKRVLRAAFLYTVMGAVALSIHPSLVLLLGASLCVLVIPLLRYWVTQTPRDRTRVILCALSMGMLLALSALANQKDSKLGFRTYLVPYYHSPTLHSIPRLVAHTYDFATYHLNVFYNTSLYWPERLNIAILPLVLLCGLGFALAVAGKFGSLARHLAFMAVVSIAITAGLSMFRRFPFGGLRQTLFLSPFLFTFTALAFYALRVKPAVRYLAGVVAIGYVGLWAVNLPRFYNERLDSSAALVRASEANGGLPVYGWGINDRVLAFYAHLNPQSPIRTELLWPEKHLPSANDEALATFVHQHPQDGEKFQSPKSIETTKQPFLVATPPLEMFRQNSFRAYMREVGATIQAVDAGPAIHPESDLYRTCLYYPPNGFWIYKVKPAD